MTNREEEVLYLIKNNPLISQNELAKLLGITRSSVGVHITNLIKKGYINGRGYIINEENFVSIIGGANMDILGFSNDNLRTNDSNPGKIKVSLGGVGRNIGENLVRLGVNTKLITVLGDDLYGNKIVDESRILGLNLDNSLQLEGYATSVYMSILDNNGDMQVAISQMDIFENMSIEFIKQKKNVIESSKICVIDTNIPKDVLEYVVTNFKNTKFFLDTVSATKSIKAKDVIGKFHTIKPNKLEAEILSGISIKNEKDVEKASQYFLNEGVKNVFISLGEKGIYYSNGVTKGYLRSPKVKVINANGAGDSFLAGVIYSTLRNDSIYEAAKFGVGCSLLTICHENTINPNICIESVNKKLKETGLC
ncbi:PfkB family carbohydrate kinase [Clostridium sp. UBA4548]|uniref:PfkB family carbohydrate kinase n=1 Tax=Clostridium sp. UBA4548 TaxID=1946361 RepID=UPI0025C0E555|nr:PfkB family carbohydrate kinase [Clostridium sp. UBA4548]